MPPRPARNRFTIGLGLAVTVIVLCGAVPFAVFGLIDGDWLNVVLGTFAFVFAARKLVIDRRLRRAGPGAARTQPDRFTFVMSVVWMTAFFCFSAFIAVRGLLEHDWQEAAVGSVGAALTGALLLAGIRATWRRARMKQS